MHPYSDGDDVRIGASNFLAKWVEHAHIYSIVSWRCTFVNDRLTCPNFVGAGKPLSSADIMASLKHKLHAASTSNVISFHPIMQKVTQKASQKTQGDQASFSTLANIPLLGDKILQ